MAHPMKAMLEQAERDLKAKTAESTAAHSDLLTQMNQAQAKAAQLSDKLTFFIGEREALDLSGLPASKQKKTLQGIEKREAAAAKEAEDFVKESDKETGQLRAIYNSLAADARRLQGRVDFFTRLVATRKPAK